MEDESKMDGSKYFNRSYFLLELQTAGAIVNEDENDLDSFTLKKVPNITIGLVLAAKSLNLFENHIILNWIRKGRKLTSLIEEQFDLYDKLSTYLLNNICKEENIQEWKEILKNTKYVYPANDKEGWAQIFGETPNVLENVDTENIQQQTEKTETEEEINKRNEVAHTVISEREEPTLEKNNCLSILNDDGAHPAPSEGEYSSDGEDDLDDLFNEVEAELNAAEENDEQSEDITFNKVEAELNTAEENFEQSENVYFNEKKEVSNLSGTAIHSPKNEEIQDQKTPIETLISEKETKPLDVTTDNNNDLKIPANELKLKANNEIQEHKKEKKDEKSSINEVNECVLEMEAPEDELFDFLDTTLDTSISETEIKQSNDTSDNKHDSKTTIKRMDLESNNEIQAHKKNKSDQKLYFDESNLEQEELPEEAELFDFLEAELAAAESKTTNTELNQIPAKLFEESRVNSTKRRANRFENVIIFADEVHKPFLNHMEFKNDYQKVWVATDDELTPKNLKKLVPECSNLISGGQKLLCIIVTGLYNLAPLRNPKVYPLPKLPTIGNLFFEFDYRKAIYYRKKHQTMIKELLLKGWKCQRYVKEHFDADATVVLAPPLPGFITQYGNHFAAEEKFLVETYREFCTQWSKICCDMFSIQGLDTKIIKYYMLGSNEFLSVMHPSVSSQDVQVRLNDWYEMIKLLMQSNYKEKVSNTFCAPFNHDMKCRNVTKLSKCPQPHRCEICGQGGHGKKKCHVLDHTICLKYNWTSCDNPRCKYKHVCYACENAHLVINCNKNFMQHNNIQYMIQNLYRKVRYKRVILVGNQIALTQFISSRIPELKIIANIRQLVVDINLDSHESTMQALYTMQVYMVNHPEFTSDTLWILTADMTNWLESDSLCRNHFMDQLQLCKEEIKMFYLKYDLSSQFYKAEEFVKSTKPYLGANSDFILAPLIGQTVLCPPAIRPSDIPSICPPGLEKIDLNEFHKVVHDSSELQKLQIYSPGVSKNVLRETLAAIDRRWMDSVEKIMKWQNVSVFALLKYVKNKNDTFKVLDNINLTPSSKSYAYWDAFMVLLIKYLCDPMSEEMELICDFSKKIYDIRSRNLDPMSEEKDNDNEFEEKKEKIKEASTNEKTRNEDNISKTSRPENGSPEPAEWTPVLEKNDTKKTPESDGFNSIMDKINRKIRSEKIAEHIENFTQSYGLKEEKLKATESKSKHNELSLKSKTISKSKDYDALRQSKTSPSVSKKSSNILREVIIEDAKKKIFIHNLPKELKSDDVHEILKACGDTQEFEREVVDEKTKKAYCSVKFKDLSSVYKANRLLNGKTICSKTLAISQFSASGQKEWTWPVGSDRLNLPKEKDKNFDEVADKRALDRINEVVSKIEKKKKLLRGYLKSATKEKESKLQIKKEVDKEIGKEESKTKEKLKEEIVEKKLKEAFHPKDGSSPLFPCVNANEESDSRKNEENKRSRSPFHKDKRHRSRSKDRENSSRNKNDSERKRSRSRDRNNRGTSSSNKERTQVFGFRRSPSRRSRSPSRRPRRTRSRSRDRIRRSRSNDIDRLPKPESRANDRIRRSGSRDISRSKRSGSRDISRTKRSGSRDIDRTKRSGSRDMDRTKRSRSRDIDRTKRSRSRDDVNYKSDNQGLSEAERRSRAGEFSKICEGRETSGGVFYRDKEKVPKHNSRNLEKNPGYSFRLSDGNPKSRELEDMKRQLTPIQEDRSRSPRRYASNRSRSHSRSQSPPRHRSYFPPERDGTPPSGQLPLPTPPPAPRRGQYNQGPGLVTYPAMFGSVNPSTSKVQQTQPELISYPHLSQETQKPKASNSPSDSSSKFSILKICNMLFSMCDQLDILGQSLKIVLEKVFKVKHDEYEMLKVFAVDDHLLLMNMVLNRFSKLLEVAPDAQTKNTIENLVNYTKYLVKMAENPSSYSASLSSTSNESVTKTNPNPSLSDKTLMFGIDVEQVAGITLNKDTSYIIAYLKNALENIGTTPTKEMVSKLALEISIQHFKMASESSKEPISVDYGHATSSSSLRKQQPVSIDYGHGSGGNKPSSSFSTERNWGRDEDMNRSGSQPHHASWHAGQVSNAEPRYNAETNWNQQQQQRLGPHYSTEPSRSGMRMPDQQSAGHMYQSAATNYPGNTWANQSSGNMGGNYGRDPNQSNTMMPHNQWPHDYRGQGGSGTQGEWHQSYADPNSMAQTWPPQGQSSVRPQSNSSQDQYTNQRQQYY